MSSRISRIKHCGLIQNGASRQRIGMCLLIDMDNMATRGNNSCNKEVAMMDTDTIRPVRYIDWL